MDQDFGARDLNRSGAANFRLFLPDASLDPSQYQRGRFPTIASLKVVGDFQSALGGRNWTLDPAGELTRSRYTDPENQVTKGWLYELTTPVLPEGFYQYKYQVTFASGQTRLVCDPCTRYGGAADQNSGFVIGGPTRETLPLAHSPTSSSTS